MRHTVTPLFCIKKRQPINDSQIDSKVQSKTPRKNGFPDQYFIYFFENFRSTIKLVGTFFNSFKPYKARQITNLRFLCFKQEK
jgi:hypothetical protein